MIYFVSLCNINEEELHAQSSKLYTSLHICTNCLAYFFTINYVAGQFVYGTVNASSRNSICTGIFVQQLNPYPFCHESLLP